MFFHYLKIAFRNLMKYKLQTLANVVALAVGVVTLTATHFVLEYFKEPAILSESYAKDCYFVTLLDMSGKIAPLANQVNIKHDYNDALTANGGLASVERLTITPSYFLSQDFFFTLPDSTKKMKECDMVLAPSDYLNFRAIRSAITGEVIPVLKKGEIVLSEYEARQIFGDSNPIGVRAQINVFNYMNTSAIFTVRDVYKIDRLTETFTPKIFVPFDEEAEYYRRNIPNVGTIYEMQLREGYTIEQFTEEANNLLRQYELQVNTTPMEKQIEFRFSNMRTTRAVVYMISSLVLLASLVGFLKMQLQLFNMRRREVSLRIVHGASKKSLFTLFLTEVAIVLVLSFVTAFFIAAWLAESLQRHFSELFAELGWVVEGVEWSLLAISLLVAVVCIVVVWVALWRIVKMRQGVATSLHRSVGHRVRNTMLGLQLIVGLIFLGGTFVLVQLVGYARERMNIPCNDDFYKKCISVTVTNHKVRDDNAVRFKEYLDNETSEVDNYFAYKDVSYELMDIQDNELVKEELYASTYVMTRQFDNDKFIDFWKLSVNYTRPELKGKTHILLREELYELLTEAGVGCETLQFRYCPSIPVAGTYKRFPYSEIVYECILVNCELMDYYEFEYIVVPKDGEYPKVFDDMKNEIMRIDPSLVVPKVENLREKVAAEVHIFENMERGAWILSFVSFVVCIMGIYSSISLDTRSRLKEVAVRKVHGAKRRDIALLFGRLYLWLFTVAAIVTIPLIIIFCNQMEYSFANMIPSGEQLTPYVAIVYSFAITFAVVATIVWWHIQKVMRLNQSDIIAKE